MFESLASCFAFRYSAPLNSPQDESAVADMTNLFCIYEMVSNLIQKPAIRWIIQKAATLPMLYGARRHAQVG